MIMLSPFVIEALNTPSEVGLRPARGDKLSLLTLEYKKHGGKKIQKK